VSIFYYFGSGISNSNAFSKQRGAFFRADRYSILFADRGVYSHVLGYLGGVSWALCTARVCQLYPNATASVVVSRFFKIYKEWKWPFPVMLKSNDDVSSAVPNVLGWRQQQQKFEKLPVITPAFPSMNSSHNVFQSTLAILIEEFKRGAQITHEIEQGKASWDKLFEKSEFFHLYRHYLQIAVFAEAEDLHRSLCVSSFYSVWLLCSFSPVLHSFHLSGTPVAKALCDENCSSSSS
jgi:poly(A) polymerase Pap1